MRFLKHITLLILLPIPGILTITCAGPRVASAHIKHPTDIMITPGENVGVYTSLGTIFVHDIEYQMGCFIKGTGGSEFGFLPDPAALLPGGATSNEMGKEMEEFINSRFIEQARKLGANAVIKVRYFHTKAGICLPLFGPLSEVRTVAEGEAVLLKFRKN